MSEAGPLRAVLQAFSDGAGSLTDVAKRTGLSRDMVQTAVEHLVRMGRLSAKELASGCPGGGCGHCASGVDDGPGCGAAGPSSGRTGPVLVALTVQTRAGTASG